MLTGQPPFRADDAQTTLQCVIAVAPIPPRSLCENLPPDLEAICLKCLEKDPAARYASARELSDDLGRLLDGRTVRVRALSTMQRLRRLARREPWFAAAAGAAALSMIIGITTTTLQWRRAEQALAVANTQRALAEARSAHCVDGQPASGRKQ